MAEPTAAASPTPPASLPTSEPGPAAGGGGNNNAASPDDFLALAPRDAAAASRGSGDSPPPPERKQQQSGANNNSNSNNTTTSTNTNRRDAQRYGLGGSGSGNPMKFQFYVPAGGDDSSSDTTNANNTNTNSSNSCTSSDLDRIAEGGPGRTSPSTTTSSSSSRVVGGGVGNNNNNLKKMQQQQQQQNTTCSGGGGAGTKTKGIDPPEKELPTNMMSMSAEDSARKARSRLIQLQHRESHSTASSASLASGPHSSSIQQQGNTTSLVSDSNRSTKRRGRKGVPSSFAALESIDAAENENHDSSSDTEDDDDDYPLVTMDPVESDDEPVSDHFYEDAEPPSSTSMLQTSLQLQMQQPSSQQQHPSRYRSPVQNRPTEMLSYMQKHPSSAPQRPSHRLPPQQLMQYLHAGGRGSFAGRLQQGGEVGQGGGMFPLPLNNNNAGPSIGSGSSGSGPPQEQHGVQHFPRQGQSGQHHYRNMQHQRQQTHPQQKQRRSHTKYHTISQPISGGPHSSHVNRTRRKSSDMMHDLHSDGMDMLEQAPSEARERNEVSSHANRTRRKSSDMMHDLYSDGIDILEQAASEARERDEVDTLVDGINYLRGLEGALLNKGGESGSQQQQQQQYGVSVGTGGMSGMQGGMERHSPRKAVPPPPPPPFKQPTTVGSGGSNRPHRPPPKSKTPGSGDGVQMNRTRSNSLGDEMEKLAMQVYQQEAQQQDGQQLVPSGRHSGTQGGQPGGQQQGNQQQGEGRVHRPPPPRKQQSLSNPTSPTQVRKRPVITAAAAMDFVMSATTSSRLPYEGDTNGERGEGRIERADRESDTQVENDIHKMQSFLTAMMREDGEDGIAVSAGGGQSNAFDIARIDGDDDDLETSSSSGGEDTGDEDDFERNTSLSMHAEAKFSTKPGSNPQFGSSGGGGAGGSSRYAEDKRGTRLAASMPQLDRMASITSLEADSSPRRTVSGSNSSSIGGMNASDPSFHIRKKGGRSTNLSKSTKSMDPPEANEVHDDHNHDLDDEHDSDGISPSVLPMRTMDKQLYAVEAVIPTPTRYHDVFTDEVDSFDQNMPRLDTHDDVGGSGSGMPSHALGPRSQRLGGITGVVLDNMSSEDNNRDYHRPKNVMERERLNTEPPSEESSSIESSSTEEDNDDPQSTPGADRSPGSLEKYSWSGELLTEGGNRQATSLMMKLCSHLLPAGLDGFDHRKDGNSLTSLLTLNKSTDLEWDDDDPDEPGYIVHHLNNSQLISVENAFEKMVSALERMSEKSVRNGQQSSNKNDKNNFERDLEEAELILDREEKRYEVEKSRGTKKSSDPDISSRSNDVGMELQPKQRQENDVHRESVPDFPGIYPPGKGKPGEMECFYLPIITKSQKTGFEPTKDLVLKSGSVFANNYLVQSELGTAAFSTAYRCLDLSSEEDEDGYQDEVCLKVIKNTKDYFDQSLDEIKILQLLKDTGRVQENNLLEMKSFFYHREHLVIVTELLRQNLYEFGKSILESRGSLYFTRMRLSHITRQCLIALKFVHQLGLMHCDIKPENILLSSYSRALVKVIDFGSSSFVTDRQSSYIQSRSYRAPEVILGLPYGGKIDMWSLGCCIAELYTNEVTFQNESELSMLSRIEAICGPFPRHMIAKGRNSHRIFTDSGLIYEKVPAEDGDDDRSHVGSSEEGDDDADKTLFNVYQPKMTTVAARLGFDEDFMDQPKLSEDDKKRALFVDFISKLLTIDPDTRPCAAEALEHPWITSSLDLTEDDIRYGQ